MVITPPTFVAKYEPAWDAAQQSLNTSVTTEVGDVLVFAGLGSNANAIPGEPTGGTGLTWTLQQSVNVSTSWCVVNLYTATATTAETFTLSSTAAGSGAHWGFTVYRFSGVDSIGASAKANASGAPSLSLTTTADDSAVAVFAADWNSVDGSSRTWLTGAGTLTEETYARVASAYTVFGGFHADAGAAGAKTVGLSAPTGQKYSMVAVELLGTEDVPGVGGTIVEWDTTADPDPTTTVGTVTYPGGNVIEVAGGNGSANVRWNPGTVTANAEMAARFYVKYDDAWATGTVHLMSWFADSGSVTLGRLAVTNDGAIRIVNAAGQTVSESSTKIPLNTWLRFEVEWAAGALDVRVYSTALAELLHLGPASVATSQWQALWFGHTNNSQNPPTLSLANIKVTDSAADSPIGARASDAAATSAVYRIVDGMLVPLTVTML